ncbi:MAG: hypothetical protein ABFQ62_03700 [Patescibacteria group bacterium]
MKLNTKLKLSSLTLKIFIELILYIFLLCAIEVLLWWSVLSFAHSSGCIVMDAGLFKPPSAQCSASLFYGEFLKNFMIQYSKVVGIPLFLIYIFLLSRPIESVLLLLLISFVISLMIEKSSRSLTNLPNFPIITRVIFKKIKGPINILKTSKEKVKC